MKKKLASLCAIMLLTGAFGAGAEEVNTVKKGSPEFERIKTLIGKWAGKVDMGQGPVEMITEYRLIAGGTVVEERIFADTPNEMVTMYFDKDGKLAMTHYCVLGNRPQMTLTKTDDKSITLDFDSACGIDPKKENHMHGVTIVFEDANTITTSCTGFMNGKETSGHATTLKRVK